ncbi:sulfotransferase family 2 domain-containing protein [Sulfitobacter delicatus]|uniref:Sulfotransferase family protein n=1 Tax=Sulfitobacter delicatus TaxID=218672 RepID=A0A1G7HA65_9RHOB|nr:sulfotransferase family 2 domain-containing protein [Sulfitobacter delicatus]SDE97330.1 Sulfotransferase family protein [Sulfitobacter delicatus]
MVVNCAKHNISYFGVPKCASSSLKALLYQAEHGVEFVPYTGKNGRRVHIHNVYPTRPFAEVGSSRLEGAWTFAMVRNPLARISSCYKNRILTGPASKRLKSGDPVAEEMGLAANPTLDAFVSRLEDFRTFDKDVWWHTAPLVYFLGDDASFYSALFDMSELASCYEALKKHIGNLPALPHLQRRGQHLEVGSFSSKSIDKIRDTYAKDFQVYGSYFA